MVRHECHDQDIALLADARLHQVDDRALALGLAEAGEVVLPLEQGDALSRQVDVDAFGLRDVFVGPHVGVTRKEVVAHARVCGAEDTPSYGVEGLEKKDGVRPARFEGCDVPGGVHALVGAAR